MISDINQETVNRYFSTLLLEGISPQSYNNKIKAVTDASTEQQREKNFVAIKEEVKRMSLERQVEFYEKKIKELIRENESLQVENAKLKRKNS